MEAFFKRKVSQELKTSKESSPAGTARKSKISIKKQKLEPSTINIKSSDAIDNGKFFTEIATPLVESKWSSILQSELSEDYFKNLLDFIRKEFEQKTIYPSAKKIFRAFTLCSLPNLKVVILGQDPYHQPNQATGLAFDVADGIKKPPSLRNIFKEVNNCLETPSPKSLDNFSLMPWAEQGVLLLNTVLTVEKAKPLSHRKKGWETFTDTVIKKINENKENVIFLLWGKPAQKKADMIDSKKHFIITTSHPSPLAALKTKSPFIGSRCFNKVNEHLVSNNQTPINWI